MHPRLHSTLFVVLLFAFFTAQYLAQNPEEIVITHAQLGRPISRTEERSLQAEGVAYYRLNYKEDDQKLPIENGQSIFFLVTPLSGDVDLYVSVNNIPTWDESGHCATCLRESIKAHGDLVGIARSDPAWPTDESFSFHIAVRSYSTKSSFTLTTWISDNGDSQQGTVIELEDGMPQVAKTIGGQYTFFKFKISDDSTTEITGRTNPNDFAINIVPVSGDPDIYCSTDNTRPRKNGENIYWKSDRWGDDHVTIRSTDDHYTRDGYYYIGITAWSFVGDSLFTLTVTSRKRYTNVIEAVGFVDTVNSGDYKYYKYYITQSNTDRIVQNVSPLQTGDPDLFVALQSEVTPENPPSPTNCHNGQWCRQRSGEDTVVVEKDQTVAGYLYSAVKGYRTTKYQFLTTTERNNILLQDGFNVNLPVVPGKYLYFKYFHNDRDSGLALQATGSPNTNIQMYIADESGNSHPDPIKHDHVAATQGNIASYYYTPPVRFNTFFMSVTSDVATNVSMVAYTNQTAIPLIDGRPLIDNHVPQGAYRYFYFDATLNDEGKIESDVAVAVNARIGDVDIYVSTQMDRPTLEKCDATPDQCWISATWGQDGVVISNTDPKLAQRTRFFIAVFGKSHYTHVNYFSIMASMASDVRILSDGVAVPGNAKLDDYAYYAFDIENQADFTVELSLNDAQNTDADMYMSRHPKPDRVYCEGSSWDCYKSEKLGNDVIHLSHATPGRWYISVLARTAPSGQETVSFTVKASEKYHFIYPNFVPYIYESTPMGRTQEVRASYISSHAKIAIVSTTLISGRTNMYVTANNTPADALNYQWKDTRWPGNLVVVRNTEETKHLFGRPWFIGVEAAEDSDYWLSVSTSSLSENIWDRSRLALSVPRLTYAPVEAPMVYYFFVPYNLTNYDTPPEVDYFINIRILQGSLKLYVGQDPTLIPSASNHTYQHIGSNDRFLHMDRKTIKRGLLLISAQGNNEDCTFELTISAGNEPRYLTQDQPQLFYTSYAAYTYFQIFNSKGSPRDLQVTAESCDMHDAPQFFIGANDTTNPTKEDNLAKSSGTGFRQVSRIRIPATKYYIGVLGSGGSQSGSSYSILATTHVDATRPKLSNGALTAKRVKAQAEYRSYELTIPYANPPTRFSDKPLIYEVYMNEIEMKSSTNPIEVNYKTVCGVNRNLRYIGVYEAELNQRSNINFIVNNVDPKRVYVVNVIVHDGLGLQTSYDGVWIVRGDVYPTFPNFIQALMISPGTIVLLFLSTIVVLYFLIGSIVNIARGKHGLDVIPHRRFWFDLPHLIKDGALFIVTCGRRTTSMKSYTEDDEFGVTSDVNTVNLGTTSSKANNEDDDGYGAI